MDLSALDPAQPQVFYLSDRSLEALSDCYAVVGGTRLPLHSQVLSLHSPVLRDLFVERIAAIFNKDGAQLDAASHLALPELPDLSAAFQSSSVEEAACLLRLLYRPHAQDASAASFAALLAAGRLPAVAALAAQLGAEPVVSGLEQHLEGVCRGADMQQLLDGLRAAQRCCSASMQSRLLDSIAAQLATMGLRMPAIMQPAAQAALDNATLAALLLRLAQNVPAGAFRLPPIAEVHQGGDGASSGGCTFALAGFKRQREVLESPWVEIGGMHWGLKVHTRGAGSGAKTHLSAQVVWNSADPAAVRVASVSARFSIAVVDQQEGGHDLRQAEEAPLTFTRAAAAHCWEQLASRADLRAPGTGRLLHDRLLLRADITVDSIDSDSSEKESSSSEEESSSSSGSDGGMKE